MLSLSITLILISPSNFLLPWASLCPCICISILLSPTLCLALSLNYAVAALLQSYSAFILHAFNFPYWQSYKKNYTSLNFYLSLSVSHALKPRLFTFTATAWAYLINKPHIYVLPTTFMLCLQKGLKHIQYVFIFFKFGMQLRKNSRV